MNGLDLLVIAAALAAAIALLRQEEKRRANRLLGPAQAVRRDGAPVLPLVATTARSEQQEAYDRWQVSDECDPHKLPAATAHLTINEPAWRDPEIRDRFDELRRNVRQERRR